MTFTSSIRLGLLPHRQLRRPRRSSAPSTSSRKTRRSTTISATPWKVGRTLEARFQWSHARDLKPDPEDLPRSKPRFATACCPEEGSGRRLYAGAARTTRAADRVSDLSAISPASSIRCRASMRQGQLALHVLGHRRADGYHELESLVAFADCADTLTFAVGDELALDVTSRAPPVRRSRRQSGAEGGAACSGWRV